MMDEDIRDYKPPKKTWRQTIAETPCMKKSLMNGIGGGIGTGLLTFLFTSNAKRASDFGMGGFFIVSCSIWCYCRYQFSKHRWDSRVAQEALRGKILTEGTDLEKTIQQESKDV